jgi:membrane protein DedA with SNARE-associated domain
MMKLQPYLDQYGYWAVFTAVLVEDFGVPMPGEAMLIAGSLLASQGHMQLVRLLFTAWIGAVAGDNIGYAIGRFGGRALVARYGHYVLISQKRLESAEVFFRRYGGAVVVVARFFEVLRQFNGLVAGIVEMGWWRFLPYNAFGAALWVSFWGMLFYHLGENVSWFESSFRKMELLVLVGLAVTAAGFAIYSLLRRK